MTCPGTHCKGKGVRRAGVIAGRRPWAWIVAIGWLAAMGPSTASAQRGPGDSPLVGPRMATITVPEPDLDDFGTRWTDENVRPESEPAGSAEPADLLPAETDGLFGRGWRRRLLAPRFFRLPEERFPGPGEPLTQESWLFRPYSIGGFYGFVQGGEVIRDWTYEKQGRVAGMTLGWDAHHYFGCEMRMAMGRVVIGDTWRAIQAQNEADDAGGMGPADPARRRFDNGRDNDLFLWQVNFLYYPWGDSRWRPYATVGLGLTAVDFVDRLSVEYHDSFVTMPFGVGVKYLHTDRLAFRLECIDYMAIGGGKPIGTVHNVSVSAGFEVRFGGARRAYWPWNPGRHYW